MPKVPEAALATTTTLELLADLLHRRYYAELNRVFEENKVRAKHPHDSLDMQPPVQFLTQEEFETEWAALLASSSSLSSPPPLSPSSSERGGGSSAATAAPETSVLGVEEYFVAAFFWFFSNLSGHYLTLLKLLEPVLTPLTGISAADFDAYMWHYGSAGFFGSVMFIYTVYFFFIKTVITYTHGGGKVHKAQAPSPKLHRD